jgi:aminopeptidase N
VRLPLMPSHRYRLALQALNAAGGGPLSPATAFDAPAQRFTLTLTQHTAPSPGQPEKQPLQIPVRVSLLDGDGKPLPLQLAGAAARAGTEVVLSLTEAQQRYVFEGVPSAPVPSLLRASRASMTQ